MVDKNTIFQVLCSLMNRPYLLDEVEKYQLTPQDFSSLFEKYIFSAVYNLHKDGAEKVSEAVQETAETVEEAAEELKAEAEPAAQSMQEATRRRRAGRQ